MSATEEAESLISKVSEHFFTEEFQGAVDAFISEKAHVFLDVTDAATEDGEDHKIEYWTVYQEFTALFEAKVEEFLKLEGSSSSDFYRHCKELTRSGDEWGEAATFMNLLVATTDYSAFLELMKDEARDAAERAERDAEDSKEGGDDGDEEGKRESKK